MTAPCQMQRDRHFPHLLRRFLRALRSNGRAGEDATDDGDSSISELPVRVLTSSSCLPARVHVSRSRSVVERILGQMGLLPWPDAMMGRPRAGLRSEASHYLGVPPSLNASASESDNIANKQPDVSGWTVARCGAPQWFTRQLQYSIQLLRCSGAPFRGSNEMKMWLRSFHGGSLR